MLLLKLEMRWHIYAEENLGRNNSYLTIIPWNNNKQLLICDHATWL